MSNNFIKKFDYLLQQAPAQNKVQGAGLSVFETIFLNHYTFIDHD